MFDQIAIISILAVMLSLFIWGKWRYDIVALMALLASTIIGLVEPHDMFMGFGHPATITVALVLSLGTALTRAGAIEILSDIINPLHKYPLIQMIVLIFIAAFLSMFMNNVGALGLIMPLAIAASTNAGRSPSLILMPLSFGSILGGLVTLIGTPPNIIISMYRQNITGEPFGIFDFSPVGGAVAIVGILFLCLFGSKLVKVRKKAAEKSIFEIGSYLFELKIPKDSKIIDNTIDFITQNIGEINVEVISLIHKRQFYGLLPKNHVFSSGDILLVEGAQDQVDKFCQRFNVKLVAADSSKSEIFHSLETDTIEAVVSHDSRLVNRAVGNVRFKSYYGVNLLAISREGIIHSGRLRDFVLTTGDVLLLHGIKENIDLALSKLGCFPLLKRELDFGKRENALLSISIFIFCLSLSTFGFISIQTSLMLAIVLMFLFKITDANSVYDGIEWPVIVLLGALIPVGNALETTGTTDIIANSLLSLLKNNSPIFALTMIMIITMTLSDLLNNAATVILMAPIAKSMADSMGVNVDPFLMGIAIAASCAFLTPIGHQNNAIIMGPGGYKFHDYWRLGLPLEILILLISIPLITIVWPL